MTEKKNKEYIGKKLGIAALVAIVLLVMVVLPAEYGIDPTGLGRWTGISKLSDPSSCLYSRFWPNDDIQHRRV